MSTYKIISGHQTGVDMASTLAARESGLEIGGYAPQGYWTERGPNMNLKKWGLKDFHVRGYDQRDRANVEMCDLVIAFRLDRPKTGRGTTKTLNYAYKGSYVDSKYPTFSDAQSNGTIELMPAQSSNRPVMIVWDPMTHKNSGEYSTLIANFIKKQKPANGSDQVVVLFSGPCESTCQGIQDYVKGILKGAFEQLITHKLPKANCVI